MKTIGERAKIALGAYDWNIYYHYSELTEDSFKEGYIQGATEQKAIDIKIIPQLYVRWLMIDGEKPTWEEYANKAMEE